MIQSVLLGDVAEKIAMGPFGSNIKVSTFTEAGIPIISGQHLKGITVDDGEGYNFISTEHADKLQNSNVFRGDVVFTHAGNIGQVAYIPQNSKYDRYVLSQRQFYLRPSKELSGEYLTYYFKSPKGQSQLLEFANQTGVPSLSQPATNLKKIKIELPDLETQKKIADVLGTIDEKIELNRRMNETLEQMGQALFRHYFVENPEAEKWKKKPLGDYVELVNGASYKSAELQPSSNALVTLKSVGRGGGFSRRGYKEYTGKMKDAQIVNDGDLVVAHTDLTQKAEVAGYPALVDGADQYDQVAISMDLVKVMPRSKELSSSVVYFLLKTREFQDHKMGYISGSTVLHLNKKCIPSYEIALPSDEETLQAISSEFGDLMEKIKSNNQQTQTLTTLRDTLLPRLISGKMRA